MPRLCLKILLTRNEGKCPVDLLVCQIDLRLSTVYPDPGSNHQADIVKSQDDSNWTTDHLHLLERSHKSLPYRPDLLHTFGGQILHPNLRSMSLVACLLNSSNTDTRTSHRILWTFWENLNVHPWKHPTFSNEGDSVSGVLSTALILLPFKKKPFYHIFVIWPDKAYRSLQ